MENQIPPNYPNHDPLRRRLNNFEASGLFLNYLTKEAKGCKIVPFLPLVLMLGPVAALKIKKIWKIIPGPFQHLSQNFLSATSALFSLLGDPNAEVPQLIISSGLEQSLIKLNSSSRTVVNGILSKGQGEEVILNAPELLKRVSPLTDFPCHLRYQGIDEDVKMFLQKRDIQRPRVPFGEHRGLACLVWLRFFENKLGLILDPNMYEDLRKEFPLLLTSQIEMMWTKIYGPIIRPVYVGKQVRQATRLLMVLDILDYLDDEEHGNFRKLFSDRYVVQWVLQGRSNHS